MSYFKRTSSRSLLAIPVAVLTVLGLMPVPLAEATVLTLTPKTVKTVSIGGKRTSSIASVSVTVPARPVDFGVQLRASSGKNGYRVVVSVGADGAVSGSFRRVKKGVETALGKPVALGFAMAAGGTVKFEAAAAGLSPARLYLRAWKSGSIKPPNWQASVADSAKSRYQKAGRSYLWARSSQVIRLSYTSVSVAAYTLKRAQSVGVVRPEPNGATFSIAVVPDTQTEVHTDTDPALLHRMDWLVANREEFDLRYLLHTGDQTDWGWLDPPQFLRARAAIEVVRAAGVPYGLAIGNHDTAVVGWDGVGGSQSYGGAAYAGSPECAERLGIDQCSSWLLLRATEAFNEFFPLGELADVGGVFEDGKSDNVWTSFEVNDTKWMVLTLELWPRKEVVEWARKVVAAHPERNVIIQTHQYLSSTGAISTSNGGYGETDPKYLYDQIVSKYSNVKLVFSGHNGSFTSRTDRPSGNTVVSYLGNYLKSAANPVRILTIDTATGAVYSSVYDPLRKTTFDSTVHQIKLVR